MQITGKVFITIYKTEMLTVKYFAYSINAIINLKNAQNFFVAEEKHSQQIPLLQS